MSTQQQLKVIFGSFVVTEYTPEVQKEVWDILKSNGINQIDTAFIYTNSEKTLGELDTAKDFLIDTKTPGFYPGALSRDSILNASEKSFKELRTDSIETYFLHSPDTATPISESLNAIQELYKAGKFKRFGLSNFTAEEVQEVYDYNSSKGYVLPTVYQGNYNAMGRHLESKVLPVLRKLNIRFYVYSPLAGGFLNKKPEDFKDPSGLVGGRFDTSNMTGQVYNGLYNKEPLLSALAEWNTIAREAGVSNVALGLRWLGFHSALREKEGDAIVLGASRPEHLKSSLEALRAGPLEEHVVEKLEKFWEGVKDHAPIDNFHG